MNSAAAAVFFIQALNFKQVREEETKELKEKRLPLITHAMMPLDFEIQSTPDLVNVNIVNNPGLVN